MDLLHLDFTKIKISSDSEKELKKKPEIMNVLMIMDHFTWNMMAFITKDTTARTVVHVLYHHYFYIFGTQETTTRMCPVKCLLKLYST